MTKENLDKEVNRLYTTFKDNIHPKLLCVLPELLVFVALGNLTAEMRKSLMGRYDKIWEEVAKMGGHL